MKLEKALILSLFGFFAQAQVNQEADSLSEVKVRFSGNQSIKHLSGVCEQGYIVEGKKNEMITVSGINANTSTNNVRQVFSRIPGVSTYENDGSGIQISVGSRGLSPNRSWEFNTRQNGYDVSSDVFGYPEAYYNPPINAVEKIQLIRGAASLQFGPQFGGLLNYNLKRIHEENKPISVEASLTGGSYGMFNNYVAVGGNTKKVNYYVYNDYRQADGWRQNSKYDVRNTHAYFQYKFSPKFQLAAEYTNMEYKMQQSGGLTDAMFAENHQQSVRSRNWFNVPWQVANITADYKVNDNLSFNLKVFGLLGERNSVGNVKAINIVDDGSNRQVDRDYYKNFGSELRGLYSYNLFGNKNSLAFGSRFHKGNTERKQRGGGTNGSDLDLTLNSNYTTEYDFNITNFAFFAENIFNPIENFTITPGIRIESINNTASGINNNITQNDKESDRFMVLSGINIQYKIGKTNIYGGFSQAYRPVTFANLAPSATTDVVDSNLKDSKGFNAELGYRGNVKDYLTFDANLFYIQYDNRVSNLQKYYDESDISKGSYRFITNVGDSYNKGIEVFAEFNLTKAFFRNSKVGDFNLFGTFSLIDAQYKDFIVSSGSNPIVYKNYKGNKVEYAPNYVHTVGLTYRKAGFSSTVQGRFNGEVYSDAQNTETPTTEGNNGKISSYKVYDWSFSYNFLKFYSVNGGVNNFLDEKYATRRAGGYPGPGLIPGEARTFYVGVAFKW